MSRMESANGIQNVDGFYPTANWTTIKDLSGLTRISSIISLNAATDGE